VDRPSVIGFLAPKIVVPGWLLEKLTRAELEQIVQHELGHLRRRDDWMNLLQKLALVVFPWNPALAWVERRLCSERELACDDAVLREISSATAYASCLTAVAEYRLGRQRGTAIGSLALGALGRQSELSRRVERILRRGAGMSPWQTRTAMGLAVLTVVSGATELSRCRDVVGFAAPEMAQVRPITNGDSKIYREGRIQQVNYRAGGRAQEVMLKATVGPAPVGGVVGPTVPRGLKAKASSKSSGAAEGLAGVAALSREAMTGVAVEMTATPAELEAERLVEARYVQRWVVVASWTDDEGARTVLTTSGVDSQQVPQIVQYTAVPVRGWLVIQL
jgi:hypothetical protein